MSLEVQNLYRELQAYGKCDAYPYHMPGHKRKSLGSMPDDILNADITEIDGFDNLHQAEGILRELQDRANTLYGAEETFYLVNGSTCGILSAVHATVSEGGRILMARGSHKSVYHAAYLRGARLSYLYEQSIPEFGCNEAVSAEEVAAALQKDADVDAVLIVSPTYEGRVADVKAIADIVHSYGIPLIVDEAHGAHLGFDERFAPGSCRQGADLVIHSVHKTLPALTQTALLHVNGELVNRAKLRRYLHIFQSSSPSYLLMASIADALEIVEKQGAERFSFFWQRYREMLEKLQKCRHLEFFPWKDVEEKRQDVGKLVIAMANGAPLGQWIYDLLRIKYHLQCEMAAGSFCLAMFTMADEEEAYARMEKALSEIDGMLESSSWAEDGQSSAIRGNCLSENVIYDGTESVDGKFDSREQAHSDTGAVSPEEYCGRVISCEGKEEILFASAWDCPGEEVRLSEMIGRPVAEFINLYPPGIPLLVPGEIFTEPMYEKIAGYIRQGLQVQGIEKSRKL